jgi:hypothetical protein
VWSLRKAVCVHDSGGANLFQKQHLHRDDFLLRLSFGCKYPCQLRYASSRSLQALPGKPRYICTRPRLFATIKYNHMILRVLGSVVRSIEAPVICKMTPELSLVATSHVERRIGQNVPQGLLEVTLLRKAMLMGWCRTTIPSQAKRRSPHPSSLRLDHRRHQSQVLLHVFAGITQ